ncbi:hypothetical protein N0V90_007456 [Kalmusia sp. IMI 367209]|nr:hypothetical protein N0V90_007456 [Kalmusia sp. IMI 367209]
MSQQTLSKTARKREAVSRFKQRTLPHDPETEPRPLHPMNERLSRDAESMAVVEGETLKEFLDNTSYKDEEVSRLLDMLYKRRQPNYETSTKVICVMGKPGQGKTATINSLIGFDLGSISGGINSVTNVVQEFRTCYQGQTDRFKVQVFLYGKPYVMKLFTDSLIDFRQHTSAQMGSDDDDDIADDENEKHRNKLIQMITDLFSFRDKCADFDATEQFLLDTDDADVLKYLERWLDIVYRRIRGEDPTKNKIEKDCSTSESVNKFIAPFICTAPEPFDEGTETQCCPYPLVESVVTAFQCNMLRAGNIIKDVPGVGDTNKAHVDRAHMALKDADRIMVVFELKRSVDNKDLYTSIKFALRRRGPQGVFLVITHSADIEDDTGIIFTTEDRRSREDLRKQIDRIESDMSLLNSQEEHADELAAKREIEAQIREKKDFEIRVVARNRTAIDAIRAKLRSKKIWKFPQELAIVCVDNKEYRKYAQGYRPWSPDSPEEAPRLSLAATGIPTLRSIITNFPADGRWETLKHYIYDTWECILNSFEMSASVTKAQRKAQVDEEIAKTLQSIVANIEELFDELVTGQIVAAKKEMGAAITKKGEFNCNQTLLAAPLKDIDRMLDDLRNKNTVELFMCLTERVRDIIDKLVNTLENDPSYDVAGIDKHIRMSIYLTRTTMVKACAEVQKKTTHAIQSIQDCAGEGIGTHSYFAAPMQKVYEKALKAKRTGSSALRPARARAFDTALKARNGPYHQLHMKIIETLTAELELQRRCLIKEIKGIFAEIQNEIDFVCSRKEDNSEEGKKFRKDIRQKKAESQERLEKEIRPKLVEAELTCNSLFVD